MSLPHIPLPAALIASGRTKVLTSLRSEAHVEDGQERMRTVLDVRVLPLVDGGQALRVSLTADEMLRLLAGGSISAKAEITGAWIGGDE